MSLPVPPPSAEAQLAFLAKLQRLFAEGDFTATYNFALLIALADLAVGDDLSSDSHVHRSPIGGCVPHLRPRRARCQACGTFLALSVLPYKQKRGVWHSTVGRFLGVQAVRCQAANG